MAIAKKRGVPSPDLRGRSPQKRIRVTSGGPRSAGGGGDSIASSSSKGRREKRAAVAAAAATAAATAAGGGGRGTQTRGVGYESTSGAASSHAHAHPRGKKDGNQRLPPAPSLPGLFHDPEGLAALQSRYKLVTLRVAAHAKLRHKVHALLSHLREEREEDKRQQQREKTGIISIATPAATTATTAAVTATSSSLSPSPSTANTTDTKTRIVLLQARGDGPGAGRLVSVVEIAKREFDRAGRRYQEQESGLEADAKDAVAKRTWFQYSRVDGRLEEWSGEDGATRRRRRLLQLANRERNAAAERDDDDNDENEAHREEDGKLDDVVSNVHAEYENANKGHEIEMEEGEVHDEEEKEEGSDGRSQAMAVRKEDNYDVHHRARNKEDGGALENDGRSRSRSSSSSSDRGVGHNAGEKYGQESDKESDEDAFESMDAAIAVPPARSPREPPHLDDAAGRRGVRMRSVPILSIFLSTIRIPELEIQLG